MNKTVDLRNEIFICGISFYTFGVAEKSKKKKKKVKRKKVEIMWKIQLKNKLNGMYYHNHHIHQAQSE